MQVTSYCFHVDRVGLGFDTFARDNNLIDINLCNFLC